MNFEQLRDELARLESLHLLRRPDDELPREALQARTGKHFVELSGNDYLGLRAPSPLTDSAPSPAHAVSRETDSLAAGKSLITRTVSMVPVTHQSARSTHPGSAEAGTFEEGSFRAGEAASVSRETGLDLPHGAGASRLVFGTSSSHLVVERMVASWLSQPAGLLFSSGYAANVGALGCLLSPGDVVLSDALNHASLIDGMRLSRADVVVVPHLDLAAVEQALRQSAHAPARWVVTESYFSMDGDAPDLRALRALCDRYQAQLYVDEAHAVGVFGPRGAGLLAEAHVAADVVMASFGKAVGSQGACVCGHPDVRTWLWNRARSFVFSTAPAPLLAHSLAAQLRRTQAAEAERRRLAELSTTVRRGLTEQGWLVPAGLRGPICPVIVGSAARALRLASALRMQGFLCQAIRPPTVPEGQCRIRLTLSASLSCDQVARLLSTLDGMKTDFSRGVLDDGC